MTTIRYATEADAPAIAELNIICFQDGPMYRNMFPNIDPLSATPMKISRTYDKLSNPKMHLLVATDSTSNQILGCSRWLMPDTSPIWRSESEMAVLSDEARAKAAQMAQLRPAGMNVAVYDGVMKALEEMRRKYVREGDIVLELLVTHPQHQGKGVGKALLDWGVRMADQKNARIYLEASPEGYPLYRKYGWRDVEDIVIDYSVYGGEGDARYVVMIREPARN
ncbi:hypothetical protein ALT_5440 [Aspergillus lentulus]|uniref:N-acetyltransferase domain-containing protein n=1 Tax=Aspergillus lentulus TaxID=293939 RepID=A0AAN4TBI1_ASPLE|nr:uncharacterized protein IFM58399_00374 [Aspergillus lentulus]KAF4165363.1 hypothetical protein CNMCM6936_007971 [Aspergillus lentulus]KAF4170349.1 hypothetical protein CNMCM8060_005905 [Aspergillus lentulus]KAF4175353.1 hypothetical protein CNMCM7927_005186 [Aspergillus lentulus]KAF4187106.1 hypothetical protein CNMCM8694_005776 [Aspergillus lentulus]GAQ08119.1 hypothetical protein ALT_5440 [Aspergillus lentulus]